jgi:hypothetical protein
VKGVLGFSDGNETNQRGTNQEQAHGAGRRARRCDYRPSDSEDSEGEAMRLKLNVLERKGFSKS